jgi:hypothetical protein
MEWMRMFGPGMQPSPQEISAFINNPLWEELSAHLEREYAVKPKYAYSGCAAQPGWNIKYQKSGRALCTLYPMPGFFIALVAIGKREAADTESLLPSLTDYVRSMYEDTGLYLGGRWLMIHVTDSAILSDVKTLINLRTKPAPKKTQ